MHKMERNSRKHSRDVSKPSELLIDKKLYSENLKNQRKWFSEQSFER